jgi:hypothetical protein
MFKSNRMESCQDLGGQRELVGKDSHLLTPLAAAWAHVPLVNVTVLTFENGVFIVGLPPYKKQLLTPLATLLPS